MKIPASLLLVSFAGCQAVPAPVAVSAAAPSPSPVLAAPISIPADASVERKVRQQAQYIDALISQNEALSARLNPAPAPMPYPSPTALAPAKPQAPAAPASEAPSRPAEVPTLTPNADGVIDVSAALLAPKAGEPVNPFALRMVPAGAVREVSIEVGGIVAGPSAFAVINDKLLQPGDTIESLTLERIETNAVVLRHGAQRMRLPIGVKNLRVRLPI